MQASAKITSKGQITVPRSVRRALGVKVGDKLIFEQTDTGFSITPARNESAFAKYQGIGNPGMEAGREAVLRAIREIRGHEEDE